MSMGAQRQVTDHQQGGNTMKTRIVSDGDIGYRVQRKDWWWPFWRTVHDRVLFLRRAEEYVRNLSRSSRPTPTKGPTP